MKNTIKIIALLLLSNISISQSNLKEKLDEVFSSERVENILNNGQKSTYYEKVLFSSYEVKTYPANKLVNSPHPVLSTINVKDKITKTSTAVDATKIPKLIQDGKFNILLTDIKRDFSTKLYYRLGNSNDVLIIYSYKALSNK